jgi:hypothetical protein
LHHFRLLFIWAVAADFLSQSFQLLRIYNSAGFLPKWRQKADFHELSRFVTTENLGFSLSVSARENNLLKKVSKIMICQILLPYLEKMINTMRCMGLNSPKDFRKSF